VTATVQFWIEPLCRESCPDCGGVCDETFEHDDAHHCNECGTWWFWNVEG
jgi:hypothetical protein